MASTSMALAYFGPIEPCSVCSHSMYPFESKAVRQFFTKNRYLNYLIIFLINYLLSLYKSA